MRICLLLVFLLATILTSPVRAEMFCRNITTDDAPAERPLERRISYIKTQLQTIAMILSTSAGLRPTMLRMFLSPEAREADLIHQELIDQHRRLQVVLARLQSSIDLVNETRQSFELTVEEEFLLLRRLEGHSDWVYALDMIHAMLWQSADSHERNFWTNCFWYLLHGPNHQFFPVPFHHWMLSVILDVRQQRMSFRTVALSLGSMVDFYQSHLLSDPIANRIMQVYTVQYDSVLNHMRRMLGRNMTVEYQQAVASRLITPAEVNMLSYSVPDLIRSAPEDMVTPVPWNPVFGR